MPLLDCTVETCTHNCDSRCCLNSIQVEGQHACKEEETSCASFDSRRDCCTNQCQDPKMQLTVDCQAVDCIYNKDRMCSANHIGISGSRARTAGETECHTFKAR